MQIQKPTEEKIQSVRIYNQICRFSYYSVMNEALWNFFLALARTNKTPALQAMLFAN